MMRAASTKMATTRATHPRPTLTHVRSTRTLLTLTAFTCVTLVSSALQPGTTLAEVSELDLSRPRGGNHLALRQLLMRDGAVPPAFSLSDTIYFGGSGSGNGTVARGGVWDWETDSGEDSEFFLDGDPVGNQFRDGWTFSDLTAVNGPSQLGCGHWSPDGVYDFENDAGSFTHRASYHANDGIDDGPAPLDDPDHPGSAWSIWIGTNLYLNPEHCGWDQTAGQGNGWSQGIQKTYRFRDDPGPDEYPTPLANAQIDIAFFHRYAVEAGYDTNWVEISFDGIFWNQVGSAANPSGIYNAGTKNAPLPSPDGGPDFVHLTHWNGQGGEGELHVRFRFEADLYLSDESGNGLHFYGWQLDNIRLLVSGEQQDLADFEEDLDGWKLRSFEGNDLDLTLEAGRTAGRFVSLSEMSCPPIPLCPEVCGLEGNILTHFPQIALPISRHFLKRAAPTQRAP